MRRSMLFVMGAVSLLGLEPLIESESGALGDLAPSIADSWWIDGRLVDMPIGVNPSVLYYNRDLFDAAYRS
jgi:ABC-type glycerol-3-phosphate transport system substrate-binding protein